MLQFSSTIVGTRFRGKAYEELLDSLPGDFQLKLEREPQNAYDANAVAVKVAVRKIPATPGVTPVSAEQANALDAFVHVGYIPRGENGALSHYMDLGKEAKAWLAAARSKVILIELDIE